MLEYIILAALIRTLEVSELIQRLAGEGFVTKRLHETRLGEFGAQLGAKS